MRKLLSIAKPPGFAYVRAGMRLSVGGLLWLAGYSHAGTVLAILAVISFFGTIEAQIARAVAGYFGQKKTKEQSDKQQDNNVKQIAAPRRAAAEQHRKTG